MLARRLLPALLATAALAAPAAASADCPGANTHLTRANVRSEARATFCLLNVERARHGLGPLRATQALGRPARHHSRDMVRDRFFAHGPYLGRLRAYTASASVWRVGENIAWGGGTLASPAEIVDMWMHSPPHRENILTGAFREIGVGIAVGTPVGGGGGTWTTDFGMRR